MYINKLARLLNKQGNEGSNNGGGVTTVKSASELLPRIIGGGNDNPDRPDDSGGDSGDLTSYNLYHGLKPGGTTVPRSAVIEEFEKDGREKFAAELLPDDEENVDVSIIKSKIKDDEKEGDKKDDDKKETSKKEDSTADEKDEVKDLLDVDLKDLKGHKGNPLSQQSGDYITKLKKKVFELDTELKAVKEKPAADHQLTEKLTALEKENAELKSKIDAEHFESSPAFKEAFVQPVVDATTRLSSYFSEVKDNTPEGKEINTLFSEAFEHANKGDEKAFDKVVDTFLEDYITGSVQKSKFTKDMEKMFVALHDRNQAMTDKSEERKKIVERRMEDTRKANITGIDRDIDSFMDKFAVEREAVFKGLEGKQLEEYKEKVYGSVPLVKKAITAFAITGKIAPELSATIQKGIAYDAIDHERNLAWMAYKDAGNKIKMLETQLTEEKAKLSKYVREPSKVRVNSSPPPSRDSSRQPVRAGGSIIAQHMRNLADA